MRLVTYRCHRTTRTGAIVGSQILDLHHATRHATNPLPTDMLALLARGPRALAAARSAVRAAARHPADAPLRPLARTTLDAPIPNPAKLFALARNYPSHIAEEGERRRLKREMAPRVFIKPSTTVNRPGGPIVLGRHAHWVDWEVELAVVIGRTAKYVALRDAPAHIAGYALVNDISERQHRIRPRLKDEHFDAFFDWLNGKWPDGFAPLGPALVTPDELPSPPHVEIRCYVNGSLMQRADTGEMIYSCPELVSYISQYVTLQPGDIIATGTPAGIGKTQGLKLRPGDVVRCEADELGILENRVVRDKARSRTPRRRSPRGAG